MLCCIVLGIIPLKDDFKLEKTLESPLDFKEIKPVHPKENPKYSWKDWCWSWSSNPLATWCEELTHWKRPWCWERLKAGGEGATEDEVVGWHHWLKGHEFEQAPGDGEGQGSQACCSPWGHKESDMTGRLNNDNKSLQTRSCHMSVICHRPGLWTQL